MVEHHHHHQETQQHIKHHQETNQLINQYNNKHLKFNKLLQFNKEVCSVELEEPLLVEWLWELEWS